jgi:hypothetical protein
LIPFLRRAESQTRKRKDRDCGPQISG